VRYEGQAIFGSVFTDSPEQAQGWADDPHGRYFAVIDHQSGQRVQRIQPTDYQRKNERTARAANDYLAQAIEKVVPLFVGFAIGWLLFSFMALNKLDYGLSDERRAGDAIRPADLVQVIEQGAAHADVDLFLLNFLPGHRGEHVQDSIKPPQIRYTKHCLFVDQCYEILYVPSTGWTGPRGLDAPRFETRRCNMVDTRRSTVNRRADFNTHELWLVVGRDMISGGEKPIGFIVTTPNHRPVAFVEVNEIDGPDFDDAVYQAASIRECNSQARYATADLRGRFARQLLGMMLIPVTNKGRTFKADSTWACGMFENVHLGDVPTLDIDAPGGAAASPAPAPRLIGLSFTLLTHDALARLKQKKSGHRASLNAAELGRTSSKKVIASTAA
jgi:hypothetical protein